MSEDHTKHVVRRQELKEEGLEMDDSSSDEDGEDNMWLHTPDLIVTIAGLDTIFYESSFFLDEIHSLTEPVFAVWTVGM